jgi:basic membrane protein A
MAGRRWSKVTAIGVATLVIAGCSNPSPDSTSSSSISCSDSETVCIGLVLEGGSVDDGAFNAAAWEGVEQAAQAAGGVAEYRDSAGPDEYASNLNDLAERGFDVVITTDVGRPDLTIAAAAAHPETHFVAISQDMSEATSNVTGLLFQDDHAGYAAGYLAGLMSKSGVVGAVLGSEAVVPLRRFGEGYRLGALAARPDATVLMSYHNVEGDSFNDPEWGAAAARNQLDQGADIIFGAGGTTGIAALLTVAESPEAGTSLFCIGIDVDQYLTVPEARPCLLTSAEKLIAAAVSDAVVSVFDGQELPRNLIGETGLAPYRELADRVPQEVTKRVNDVISGLASGSVVTGVNF